jgi:hypothetical protein
MAQYLNRATALGWAGLLLAALPAQAMAQGGADPTRPPDSIMALLAKPGPAGPADAAAAAIPARPLLQSIMITNDHAEAIIAGKVVREGGQIALGTVVRITESEVTVRTTAGLQTLKLFPGIEKRNATAQLSAAPAKRNQAHTK